MKRVFPFKEVILDIHDYTPKVSYDVLLNSVRCRSREMSQVYALGRNDAHIDMHIDIDMIWKKGI